jgi:hypothetical protein
MLDCGKKQCRKHNLLIRMTTIRYYDYLEQQLKSFLLIGDVDFVKIQRESMFHSGTVLNIV